MVKFFLSLVLLCAIGWAQSGQVILPKPANTDNKICCGRPVKPSEVRPEKIETEPGPQQKLSEAGHL
ncbi:MAG: hypothetical protein ABIL15_05805 [candidate division WOR-3 bacterium]